MGRRGGSAPAFRGESMCLGRAPSVTRKRDRKSEGNGRKEGKEGLKQTRLCYHRTTVWGSVLGVSALCLGSWDSLVSVPGIGDETSGLRRAGHGGKHVLWIIGKGGGHRSLHISRFLGIPQAGSRKHRASRSQLHWLCFPKNETEDSR
jgi:hypothetical protein